MKINLFKSIFGTKNDRELRRMGKTVQRINQLEPGMEKLSDAALAEKTGEFKQRLEKESLDALLPEAFAAVREAGKRVMKMRHFDCQLIGGITLHEGRIAEMRTGEGKTFVATLAVYLNALTGKGVHVITVNDYLAQRDADWMRPLYEFLGLTVGVILSGQKPEDKRAAYQADITYGTNNEYGFDYLRDNMAFSLEDKVQKPLHFAVVDEVDSILIDEARTPLIISGPAEDSSDVYRKINKIIPQLEKGEKIERHLPRAIAGEEEELESGHFVIDEKGRQVELTELGHQFVEGLLAKDGLLEEGVSLYAASNLMLLHHVHAGLKAHHLFQKNVDYIIQGGQIVIVDEHTGRTMPGRRWSDGIHQAIEAKENVGIKNENHTLASTTFQNYFRIYEKLSGMTGTADTEAFEFRQIYGLDVVVIPTNQPMARQDLNDVVYLTQGEKYEAIVVEIKNATEKGAPVLVGTASIESSEVLSKFLKQEGVAHKVLNAKFHEKEAEIIAQAGRPAAVTIATNMAGRGTDIVLGGNLQAELAQLKSPTDDQINAVKTDWQARHQAVLDSGGLHIIGTERHESRRIDNQLRGRSGRQGDPGFSRFYLSLEDNLMRIFASDRVRGWMKSLGMDRGEAIEHRWVTRSIENAQKKVEGRNFDIRKSLLEYDDVNNEQRKAVYGQRNFILEADSIDNVIKNIRQDVVYALIGSYIPPLSVIEQWDIPGLEAALAGEFHLPLPLQQWLLDDDRLHEDAIKKRVLSAFVESYEKKISVLGDPSLSYQLEKQVMLQTLDRMWKEHLASMDYLRQGIHLRGYAARNPKQEYKKEAFEMFEGLLDGVKYEVIRVLSTVQIHQPEEIDALERKRREAIEAQTMEFQHDDAPKANGEIESGLGAGTPVAEQSDSGKKSDNGKIEPYQRIDKKVGRNEQCPCGSGKKYKHCHGQVA